MIPQDILCQLLDEDLKQEMMSSSPPQTLSVTNGLTPLRKAHQLPAGLHDLSLSPSVVISRLSELDSPPLPAGDKAIRSESRVQTQNCRTLTSLLGTARDKKIVL